MLSIIYSKLLKIGPNNLKPCLKSLSSVQYFQNIVSTLKYPFLTKSYV